MTKFKALASGAKLVEEMKVEGGEHSGSVRDGLPHEEGEWVTSLGEVFKGTWRFGKKEELHVGKSKFITVVEWNLKNWNKHGFQKTVFSDGAVLEWNFKDGEQHGYIKRTHSDGRVNKENFKDEKQQGY